MNKYKKSKFFVLTCLNYWYKDFFCVEQYSKVKKYINYDANQNVNWKRLSEIR